MKFPKVIQDLIDDKVKIFQSEQQCYRKDGETVWMTTTLTLIRGNLICD